MGNHGSKLAGVGAAKAITASEMPKAGRVVVPTTRAILEEGVAMEMLRLALRVTMLYTMDVINCFIDY